MRESHGEQKLPAIFFFDISVIQHLFYLYRIISGKHVCKKITLILSVLVALFIFNEPIIAQEKAFPKSGEGITLFLKRHNRVGKEYHDEFIKLNKTRLGSGNSLKMGVKYHLPPLKGAAATTAKKPNYEPLFGKELAQYQVTSSELKGCCFYLVSGHGGPDPGAIGKMGNVELHEDEYAYDVMLRLARNLLMRGAKVHIIIQDAKDGIRNDRFLNNTKRETCMGAPIPFNQVRRLEQRSEKINSLFKRIENFTNALSLCISTAVVKVIRLMFSSITRIKILKANIWQRP